MLGSLSSTAATTAGSTLLPHSTSTYTHSMPSAWEILPKRSPNLPPRITRARSPVRRKLLTAASIPSVPDPVICITSCLVWNSQRRPSWVSFMHSMKAGARWYRTGRAIARRTRSGTGVGPAVRRYSFMRSFLLRLASSGPRNSRAGSITSWPIVQGRCNQRLAKFNHVAGPVFRRAFRLSRHGDSDWGVAADQARRPPGAAGTERHRQVDRAAASGGRSAGGRRRRARAGTRQRRLPAAVAGVLRPRHVDGRAAGTVRRTAKAARRADRAGTPAGGRRGHGRRPFPLRRAAEPLSP